MADVFTVAKRSAVMARIRSRGNLDTELKALRLFRSHGIRGWRRNARVFGKPDFVFPTARLAVFIDGCFWHRHAGCKFCYTPSTRQEFWLPKFERNIARDRLVTRTLRRLGWRVFRVWECDLIAKRQSRVVRRLNAALAASPRPAGQTRT